MNKYLLYIISAFYVIACSAVNLSAQEQKAGEYQVKALFLYNFINFVDWPAESSIHLSPTINVCIIGDDPFDNALDDIRDNTVKDKKLAIRFYRPYDEPKGCHLLFIPATEKRHVAQILKSVREANVLIVGDTEESARQGAIIGFYIEQKKVRFAINIDAARRAGLKISAKLLKLAKIIKASDD
ncbi:MAG TPA: YfiR family protein [Geobacteraceae bacterium]|nr:YfiR family protein [Geobacteraceae bacterium]